MNVNMTEGTIRNTKVFLNRTELKGSEVAAYNVIMEALDNPEEKLTEQELLSQVSLDTLVTEIEQRQAKAPCVPVS